MLNMDPGKRDYGRSAKEGFLGIVPELSLEGNTKKQAESQFQAHACEHLYPPPVAAILSLSYGQHSAVSFEKGSKDKSVRGGAVSKRVMVLHLSGVNQLLCSQ